LGDPRRIRRKFDKPSHPWQGDRITEEKALIEEYGLHNKKEIWRMQTRLKRFKDQVKSIASRIDKQAKLEEKQLVDKLTSLGLMKQNDPLDVILGLANKDIFERRLQTLLVRKGLARSMSQARQFITHGHIIVDKKKITFPSYIVSVKEEALVEFVSTSTLSNIDHPERIIKEIIKEKPGKKKKSEDAEVAPLVFEEEEIEAIEEKGAVVKKEAKEDPKDKKQDSAAKPELKHSQKEEQKTEKKEKK